MVASKVTPGMDLLTAIVDKALREADNQRREIILAALIEVTSKYLDPEEDRILEESA